LRSSRSSSSKAALAAKYEALLAEALAIAQHGTPAQWADSMIETVEENIRMTETGSWPKPPARQRKRKSRK
jgi:hypothetical protein